jgi:hypothetical protein
VRSRTELARTLAQAGSPTTINRGCYLALGGASLRAMTEKKKTWLKEGVA